MIRVRFGLGGSGRGQGEFRGEELRVDLVQVHQTLPDNKVGLAIARVCHQKVQLAIRALVERQELKISWAGMMHYVIVAEEHAQIVVGESSGQACQAMVRHLRSSLLQERRYHKR